MAILRRRVTSRCEDRDTTFYLNTQKPLFVAYLQKLLFTEKPSGSDAFPNTIEFSTTLPLRFFGFHCAFLRYQRLPKQSLSYIVLGKKYVKKGHSGFMSWEEFRDLVVDEFFLLNNGFANIAEAIPWINFLDLQGYIKRMKDYSVKFDRFLEHVLKEHEERRKGVENYVATDMVDVLLQLAEDPSLEVKLQRHSVKALTQVYLCMNN